MSVAWLFPGQGSQAVGMGRGLYESSPAARRVLDLADQALGFSLTHLMFEGPAEALQETINTQPAIVAASLAAQAAFAEAWSATGRGVLPQAAFVAGHSVGEYAALVASGAADAAIGFALVRERAQRMHEAGQQRSGSMVAVLGLTREVVAEACRRARAEVPGSYVDVANHNAEKQVTIAGDREGLAAASRLCQEAGARRCVPLSVSGAFHSQAMAPAAEPLAAVVGAAPLQRATIPLLANVTAQPITEPAAIRHELVEQVAHPVLWADSMQRMVAAGTQVFVEFGAGQVLTNLAQRMEGGLGAIAVGDPQGVEAAIPWLAERIA